ncbi:MAG: DUF2752 domain-containing protein [Bacteroidales bacterium]|nr:DUF2752 domain-containing protein [Bacteroidales bacterium]
MKQKSSRRKTPPGSRSDPDKPYSHRSYLLINAVFAGIIILVFLYSAFFSPERNDYPVQCIHERVSGEPCPSCGLSRSFSYILQGDLESAAMANSYGMRIFLFFLFHLLMRLSNIMIIVRRKMYINQLVIADTSIAIITFILAFGQFFSYYLKLLF